mmetsp:Transcript_4198/g.8556  ORF Transcript_4198/g.8556 Transcript_4198/m.8556 type:complete len:204 (+) Transcript_4198:424-1035(+)
MRSRTEVPAKGDESDSKHPHDEQDGRQGQFQQSRKGQQCRSKGKAQGTNKRQDTEGNAQFGAFAKFRPRQRVGPLWSPTLDVVVFVNAHRSKEYDQTGGDQGKPLCLFALYGPQIQSHGFLCQRSGQKDGRCKGDPTGKVQIRIIDFNGPYGNGIIGIHNGGQTKAPKGQDQGNHDCFGDLSYINAPNKEIGGTSQQTNARAE